MDKKYHVSVFNKLKIIIVDEMLWYEWNKTIQDIVQWNI